MRTWLSRFWPFVAMGLAVVSCSFALGYFGVQVGNSNDNALSAKAIAEQSRQVSTEVRKAQIHACKASKQPPGGFRFIEASDKRDEIKTIQHEINQSKKFDYSKLFPNISPNKLKSLIHTQNERNRDEIKRDQQTRHALLKYNCVASFPLPSVTPPPA